MCSALSGPVLTVTAASPRVLWDAGVGVVLDDHELEAGQDGKQGQRGCWEDDTPLPSPNRQRDLINISKSFNITPKLRIYIHLHCFACVIVNEASILTWHASLSCTCSTISAMVDLFSLQQQKRDTQICE